METHQNKLGCSFLQFPKYVTTHLPKLLFSKINFSQVIASTILSVLDVLCLFIHNLEKLTNQQRETHVKKRETHVFNLSYLTYDICVSDLLYIFLRTHTHTHTGSALAEQNNVESSFGFLCIMMSPLSSCYLVPVSFFWCKYFNF